MCTICGAAPGWREPYQAIIGAHGGGAMIDEALRREAARAAGRNDLILDVATPAEYGEVEALSRAAAAGEVMTPLTAPLIAWFVDRNPLGQGFVVIARDARTRDLVGHFVFYRWRLARRRAADGPATPVPAFLFVRLYVHPDHRRRGVFAAMTTFGLALARQLGGDLAYTAPNPRSSAGFVKFGMPRRGPLPFWARPAAALWDLAGGSSAGGRGIDVQRRDRFAEDLAPPLAQWLPASTSWWSPRVAEVLNWRYADRPDVEYGIRDLLDRGVRVGYLVTRSMTIGGRRVVAVCDAWTAAGRAAALRAGLRDALAADPRARLAIAVGGAAAAPELGRAFRRAGFVRCPTRFLPQPVVIHATSLRAEAGEVPDLDAWHLTPFDWDVF
jgi:GNAT superfamily N-acetyltransferase